MYKLVIISLLSFFTLFSQEIQTDKELVNLALNNEHSSFGASFYGNDKIVFAASESGTNLNLFVANINKENMQSSGLFSSAMSKDSHQTNVAFTKDKKTMYFTKSIKGKENTTRAKKNKRARIAIYKATLSANGKWENIEALPFNNPNYDIAHPALNKDDSVLYFTSNMPGSLGNNDIFKVNIDNDGNFSKPVNLGRGVNTQGKEMFPFMASNDILYFSSNGHPKSFGGLDIYSIKVKGDTLSKFRHLRKPVNSKGDDFSYIINPDTQIGFLSSNRSGGKGNDDIYLVKESEVCNQRLTGLIYNNTEDKVVAEAEVTLKDNNGKLIKKVRARSNGKFNFFKLKCNKSYNISSSRAGYHKAEASVTIGDEKDGTTTKNISLDEEHVEKTLYKNANGKIGFRLNETEIPPAAKYELEKIYILMKFNDNLKFIVDSHTDSRGDDAVNMKITEDRIAIVTSYLVSRGVIADNVIGTAHGETKPLNKCVNNVDCSEKEYRVNRRTTYELKEQ